MLSLALAQVLASSTIFLFLILADSTRWIPRHDELAAGRDIHPSSRERITFEPAALTAAAAWLAERMDLDDVVLGRTRTGNYLAGLIPGRVFVGHWVGTLDFAVREHAAERFYREGDTNDAWLSFASANRIRYVVYGPRERGLGPTDRDVQLMLRPVYAETEVVIYEVVDPMASR